MIAKLLLWYRARKLSKFMAEMTRAFEALDKYVGAGHTVTGVKEGRGVWDIRIRCGKCHQVNRLASGIVEGAGCGSCHTKFSTSTQVRTSQFVN